MPGRIQTIGQEDSFGEMAMSRQEQP